MKFYRYHEENKTHWEQDMNGEYYPPRHFIPDVTLVLTEFYLVKETPKGYWIAEEPYLEILGHGWQKWISKTSRKRYAYPTEIEALNSLLLRKRSQIRILERQLLIARTAKRMAQHKLEEIDATKYPRPTIKSH